MVNLQNVFAQTEQRANTNSIFWVRILLTKSWLSENKWRDIRENPQMSFPAEANLKPYFGEMNFAEGFYYILIKYNGFHYIIQFIEIYEWINSVACIFKDIGHIQLMCVLREKNLFQIFCEFFAMYKEWRELKLWNV